MRCLQLWRLFRRIPIFRLNVIPPPLLPASSSLDQTFPLHNCSRWFSDFPHDGSRHCCTSQTSTQSCIPCFMLSAQALRPSLNPRQAPVPTRVIEASLAAGHPVPSVLRPSTLTACWAATVRPYQRPHGVLYTETLLLLRSATCDARPVPYHHRLHLNTHHKTKRLLQHGAFCSPPSTFCTFSFLAATCVIAASCHVVVRISTKSVCTSSMKSAEPMPLNVLIISQLSNLHISRMNPGFPPLVALPVLPDHTKRDPHRSHNVKRVRSTGCPSGRQ
jgi:hypothetical protein